MSTNRNNPLLRLGQGDYAKGYVFALTHWREIFAGLDALRTDREMQVILIAHAAIEKFANPETDTYDRYVPRLQKLASALVIFTSADIVSKAIYGVLLGWVATIRSSAEADDREGYPDELAVLTPTKGGVPEATGARHTPPEAGDKASA